jgi:Cys-rich protein (TIGR01571 family)
MFVQFIFTLNLYTPFRSLQPEGGVQEGQVFLSPLSKNYDGPRISAPTGSWKDDLFGCFNEGIFHPSLWCPLCCPVISMGQIMTRMQLTWLGGPGPLERTRQTFTVVILLFLADFIYQLSLNIAAGQYLPNERPPLLWYLQLAGACLMFAWQIYSLCNTRKTVRERYQIPEEKCIGCEDICCSLWCSCCTQSQILRHTGEYEHYPGVCCSVTGHPPGTPLVI